MPDSMIERVARRLHMLAPTRYLTGVDRRGHVDWALMRDHDRANYVAAARRLIEEMRIPTDAMKLAGDEMAAPSVVVWQAMIDRELAVDGRDR